MLLVCDLCTLPACCDCTDCRHHYNLEFTYLTWESKVVNTPDTPVIVQAMYTDIFYDRTELMRTRLCTAFAMPSGLITFIILCIQCKWTMVLVLYDTFLPPGGAHSGSLHNSL